MTAEVANRTSTKVLPIPPSPGVVTTLRGAIWPHRGHTDPAVPVEGIRDRILTLWPTDVPTLSVPGRSRPAVDPFHFANPARLNQLHGSPVKLVGMDLIAHPGNDSNIFSNLRDLSRLPDIVSERLLAIDMLAHLHRHDGAVGMHVVRSGNRHRVNLVALLGEHLPKILIDGCVRTYLFNSQRTFEVHIAEGDVLLVIVRRHGLDVAEPFSVRAD